MSSPDLVTAPRSIDVLPRRVSRRLSLRDGLLPTVFVLELLLGVAFGLAAHSGSGVTPAAHVTVAPPSSATATRPAYGPVIGPLRPGTVRPPVAPATVQPPTYKTHAPRNPFGVLVRTGPG